MTNHPYNFAAHFDRSQSRCRLTLTIGDNGIPLSFDDTIEFKLEIAQILATGSASAREIHGTIDQWRIKFFPNDGGFSIEIRHPIYPMKKLTLDTKQTEKFSDELQKFIDAAGQRS
jgi:hypothetical protein